MSGVYYNEIDKNAVAWLSELIAAGHLPSGDVDTRDIRDVRPDDLRGYTHCHFFAGIGGWPLALKLAGWPEDRPVWTGSCPCQPFSSAGRRDGFADERHLWPHWFHLIEQCQPDTIFGEQVASKDGLAWLDLVSDDLEGAGYALGAVDICAAGVGAPHIRQRLYFVAERLEHAESDGRDERWTEPSRWGAASGCGVVGLAHADGRQSGQAWAIQSSREHRQQSQDGCSSGRLADSERNGSHRTRRNAAESGSNGSKYGLPERGGEELCGTRPSPTNGFLGGMADAENNGNRRSTQIHAGSEAVELVTRRLGGVGPVDGQRARPTNGFWRDADWLFCRDGKWRPVEPGTFPLADGVPARVGRLRGYGNAIVIPVAQAFIEAYLESHNADRGFRSVSLSRLTFHEKFQK
jgi:DNA (cytosine-5)-methyltransferase 1